MLDNLVYKLRTFLGLVVLSRISVDTGFLSVCIVVIFSPAGNVMRGLPCRNEEHEIKQV